MQTTIIIDLNCENCIQSIIDIFITPDPDPNYTNYFNALTTLKYREGLRQAPESVLNIIKLAHKNFKLIFIDENNSI